MSETTVETQTTCYTGRVKWFNARNGYGFVTVTDGDRAGEDIFVHHSSIVVSTEQYRYLVQGEYVNFEISPIERRRGDETTEAQDADGDVETGIGAGAGASASEGAGAGSSEEPQHQWQATSVRGVSGGQLMCETRREQRVSRPRRETGSQDARRQGGGQGQMRGRSGGRGRGGRGRGMGGRGQTRGPVRERGPVSGDRVNSAGQEEWVVVRRVRRGRESGGSNAGYRGGRGRGRGGAGAGHGRMGRRNAVSM